MSFFASLSQGYLDNQLVEFHQILYMHSSWQDLAWDYYVIFRKFVPKLWPMIYAEISFPLNILRTDFFSPNFIYAFILTRSILGFLHVIFRTFVPESWPLIYTKNCFRSIS